MTLAPDLAGPVVVWRVWDVEYDRGRPELVSPVRQSPWPPRRPTTATCLRACKHVASLACTCGLYGYGDLGPSEMDWYPGRVLGCAALWGRVCEHAHGHRGEFGYPLVLFVHTLLPDPRVERMLRIASDGLEHLLEVPFADEHLARRLAGAYAVPVHDVRGSGFLRAPSPAGDAVAREAAAGQAARFTGDTAAQDRFAAVVADLVAAWSTSGDG